jgi:hypothetical protein
MKNPSLVVVLFVVSVAAMQGMSRFFEQKHSMQCRRQELAMARHAYTTASSSTGDKKNSASCKSQLGTTNQGLHHQQLIPRTYLKTI